MTQNVLLSVEEFENSICFDCGSKKRFKESNIPKSCINLHKNGRSYSKCIECIEEKLKCEWCNHVFNRTCSLHIKYIQINKIDMIKTDAGINGKSDHKNEII